MRVGSPEFAAIRRHIEAFGAPAYRDDGFLPVIGGRAGGSSRSGLFDEGHGSRTDVGGDDSFQVIEDEDHMSAVLPGSEHPIDFLRSRIVAANGLGGFGGKPDFAAREHQAVRSTQRAEVYGRQALLRDQVDRRYGVVAAAAVIGDVGKLPVGGRDHFVRIGSGGHARDYP